MNTAFYTGVSGLTAYQHGIDVTAHNISNSNTSGYKSTKAEFRELVNSNMDVNKNRSLADNEKIKTGHGVRLQGEDLLYTQGDLIPTGYDLDFAIEGEGLFAVQRNGNVEYTRNGSFDLSVEGDGCYLVTSDGAYVLDSNYQKIQVPASQNGNTLDFDNVKQQLGVFTFSNPYGLNRVDSESFVPTEISGQAAPSANGSYNVYSSVLESSNVNMAKEMADIIVTQKAYQFSARVVTTADELEQTINSLRK